MPEQPPNIDPVALVRAISHELANPVSGLVGAVELLQALGEGEPSKRRRYRELAAQTVTRLEAALKDLRHAAVVEGGPVRALDEAVARALERSGRGGRLECEFEGPVNVTVGDLLDEFLDRWLGALAPDPVLRLVRPHRFGVMLRGPAPQGEGPGLLGAIGSAGGRRVEDEDELVAFFAYPLADIRP